MKLAELARELNIPNQSFLQFIRDFDLELSECLTTSFDVKEDFIRFARENVAFLRRYAQDRDDTKSVKEIAETINQPQDKVAEVIRKDSPLLYDNGHYKSSVSSFGIDNLLGGNYQFVYNYFGKNTKLTQRDFIGYQDLFFFISEALEPYLNNVSVQNWGIHRPAGIILYGPPGSGKIFWAKKIAEIVGYQFTEIKQHYLTERLNDGAIPDFSRFLVNMMKQEKVLLFLEDFDRFMAENPTQATDDCNEKVREVILHYISHFEKENMLMVGAANSLRQLDSDLLAPGRFDVLIPVFPPNPKERAELLLYHMTAELSSDATLLRILKYNQAHALPFWTDIAQKMYAYSNTMLVDFTQSVKKRLRNIYLKQNSEQILLTEELLNGALKDASSKLTDQYLNQVEQFLHEASRLHYADFSARIEMLADDLEHYKAVPKAPSAIGFRHNAKTDEKE